MKSSWALPQSSVFPPENLIRLLQDLAGPNVHGAELVAGIICSRIGTDTDDFKRYVSPSKSDLHDPFMFSSMEAAVERLKKAISGKEKIAVFTDSDLDGITSLALINEFFSLINYDYIFRYPGKNEQYGLSAEIIDSFADAGVTLVLTADSGTSDINEIKYAAEMGIDFIITDHHEPGPELPPSIIINPKIIDSGYPFISLAGVGVVLKFCCACLTSLEIENSDFCDYGLALAAIGTIADVMPLAGENHSLVKLGIKALEKTTKTALKILIAADRPNSKLIGWSISPLLNTPARLGRPELTVDFFLSPDNDNIKLNSVINEIKTLNAQRKNDVQLICSEAIDKYSHGQERRQIVFFKLDGVSTGLTGLVANRLSDHFSRPAVVYTPTEEQPVFKGSARSTSDYDLYALISSLSGLFHKFGGHPQSLGFSIDESNIPLFEERILALLPSLSQAEKVSCADAEIDISQICRDFIELLSYMEPFGKGNEEPVFLSRRIKPLKFSRFGPARNHGRYTIDKRIDIKIIGWRMADVMEEYFASKRELDILYTLENNFFRGETNPQVLLRDISYSD